jgi:hypothetical protein
MRKSRTFCIWRVCKMKKPHMGGFWLGVIVKELEG